MSMDDLDVLRRPRSGGVFFLSFFVAAITSAGVFFGLREWVPPKDAATKPAVGVEVPEIVGMLVADARAALDQRGLLLVLEAEREDRRMSAGKINSQVPLAGSRLRPGGEVRTTVSVAPFQATVPEVAGLAVDKAIEKLVAAKLAAKAGAEVPEPSADVPAGTVIGTDPRRGHRARARHRGEAAGLVRPARPRRQIRQAALILRIVRRRPAPRLQVSTAGERSMAIERIEPEEARRDLVRRNALLVCAYDDPEKYRANYIAGALSMPQLRAIEDHLDLDRELIFYCA